MISKLNIKKPPADSVQASSAHETDALVTCAVQAFAADGAADDASSVNSSKHAPPPKAKDAPVATSLLGVMKNELNHMVSSHVTAWTSHVSTCLS